MLAGMPPRSSSPFLFGGKASVRQTAGLSPKGWNVVVTFGMVGVNILAAGGGGGGGVAVMLEGEV